MAARKSRLRKAGRLVLAAFAFFLLGVFLLFRPVLILPSRVESRISLDYKPPYPSKIELPIEVPATISPGQFGMPDEHWGERTVRTERPESESAAEGAFGTTAPSPYRRLIYRGDKLTEEAELARRDRTAPWRNRWCPWRRQDFGSPTTDWQSGLPTREWDAIIADLWIEETIRESLDWFCSCCAFWKPFPVRRITYSYDSEGRLVELTKEKPPYPGLNWDPFPWPLMPHDAAARTTRTIYNQQGRKMGELLYNDGVIDRGELNVRDTTAHIKDVYRIRGREDGYEIAYDRRATSWQVLLKGMTTWTATYDMRGKLQNDEDGIAGRGYFVKPGQNSGTRVYFDEAGKVIENDEGVAAHRGCWDQEHTWSVEAHYDASGRLTSTKDFGAASMWRFNWLLPFATESCYGTNRLIFKLYFHRDAIARFGWLRTLRLVALLAAGPAFGITLVCLLDRLRGRRKRRLA